MATNSMAQVEIVRDGQPRAAIIIPDVYLPVQMLAAQELQYHVQRATGVELPIFWEQRRPQRSGLIYIGSTNQAAEAGLGTDELPPAGYILRVTEGDIYLLGDDNDRRIGSGWQGSRTGTLFAVYEFLEREMGVRWLWPGRLGEFIPERDEITVEQLDYTGEPRFLDSGLRATTLSAPGGWASEDNRARFMADQDQWLLRHRFGGTFTHNYGHAFANWWKNYGEEHPDYFNMLPDGTRGLLEGDTTGGNVTLCVSEPALHQQIIANWAKSPERNPDYIPYRPFVNACENDSPGACTCDRCRSWDAEDERFNGHPYWDEGIIHERALRFPVLTGPQSPSLADRYARFYLALQEEARKVDPEAVIAGYAYANYWEAPRNVELNDHIMILYVPPIWYPYTEETSRVFRENWEGWQRGGTRMVLRPNLMHAGANLPIYYARRFGEDFVWAVEHGMIGTKFDSLLGAYSAQGPTIYTIARAHVRPEIGVGGILDEYYAAFGPAEEAVRSYFGHWEAVAEALTPEEMSQARVEEEGGGFKDFIRLADRLFPPPLLARGRELIEAALRDAEGDELALARVQYLEKGLRDAELTVAVRIAQKAAEEQDTDVTRDAFKEALRELVEYRASVEADGVCNFGYMAFREKHGSGWDHTSVQ